MYLLQSTYLHYLVNVKFRHYEKATKFEKISHLLWQNSCFYSVASTQVGDFFKFCGLLIMSELCCKQLHSNFRTDIQFFTCYIGKYPYFHRNIGRPENRYRIQILVGYGIPLLFIILTGIVEATGPVCSKWRPRFNEQSCFFSGYYFIFQIFLGCTS